MAAVLARHHADPPAVRLDELARDGQAEAGALDAPARLRPAAEERIEDRVAVLRERKDLQPFAALQMRGAPRSQKVASEALATVTDAAARLTATG